MSLDFAKMQFLTVLQNHCQYSTFDPIYIVINGMLRRCFYINSFTSS